MHFDRKNFVCKKPANWFQTIRNCKASPAQPAQPLLEKSWNRTSPGKLPRSLFVDHFGASISLFTEPWHTVLCTQGMAASKCLAVMRHRDWEHNRHCVEWLGEKQTNKKINQQSVKSLISCLKTLSMSMESGSQT